MTSHMMLTSRSLVHLELGSELDETLYCHFGACCHQWLAAAARCIKTFTVPSSVVAYWLLAVVARWQGGVPLQEEGERDQPRHGTGETNRSRQARQIAWNRRDK